MIHALTFQLNYKTCLIWLMLLCTLFLPTYALAVDVPEIPEESEQAKPPEVETYLKTIRSCANQGDEGFSFLNCITEEDKAVYYLERMFGDMGDVLQGQAKGIEGANSLFGALFQIYNLIILTVGTIVLVYSTIVSTINTAQEGEVMGKKWSSIWIPIRSAAGIAILMPSVNGYSLVQMFVMWVIIQSIGAGNAMWEVALKYTMTHGGLSGTTFDAGIRDVAKAALNHVVCQETINQRPDKYEALFVEQMPREDGFDIGTRFQSITSVSDQYLPTICGSITVPATVYQGDAPGTAEESTAMEKKLAADKYAKQVKIQALQAMYQYLSSQVKFAIENTSDKLALESALLGSIDIAASKYSSIIQELVSVESLSEDDQTLIKNAMLDGWIFAGSYYFKLAKGGSGVDMILKIPPTTTTISGQMPIEWQDQINKNYHLILHYAGDQDPNNSTSVGAGNAGGTAGNALSSGSSVMVKAALMFTEYLSNNKGDPIISMQRVGTDIALTIEILFFSAMFAMILILIFGWSLPYPGLIGTGWAASDIVSFIFPIIALMCSLLWGAAMTLGLYVPMIPYLVFTIASISWLLIVLETLVASPLIALGLVAPSQDTLGKAAPAVLMIANIFLRPALMIIGFMSGAQLLRVAIDLLNFGFKQAVGSQIGTLGMLGALIIITLYTSLIINVTHKCFSLIHLIPDRVIRWIGGSPGQSSDAQDLQKTQQGFDSGSKQVGELQEKGASGMGQKGHELGKYADKKLKPGYAGKDENGKTKSLNKMFKEHKANQKAGGKKPGGS